MKNRLEKAVQVAFRGAGGGGGGSHQTDDNLFSRDSVEIALALSEGPIKGLVGGGKTFFFGDTPLISQSGSPNFHPVALEMRYGYDDDKPLDFKLGGDSNSVNVGVRLLQNAAVVRTTEQILRGKINRIQVRLNFTTLYAQNDNGTYNCTANFQIAYKQSSQTTWQYVGNTTELTLTGKTTSGYIKEFNIDVPTITNDDWDIKVTKFNGDSSTTNFIDITWESFQEVSTSQQAFPDTAVVHLVGQASGQFSSIPDISGIYDGMLFQIPTNYNPYTHTFDETTPWDGSFKLDWTNNPALVLYNLIINTRYGLAKYYPHATANRYDFYNAAKWCDEQVPDGKGGTQPRYTFNAVLADGMVGKQLLDYIAGSFNAIVYDDATGTIHLKLDQWKEPSMLFTPETVTPEGFSYSYSDIATRYNDITVTFQNPDLNYNEDRRRVHDQTEIDANGTIPLDFQAVGCTNINEALRKAQYRMLTSIREVTTVTFNTTRLGILLGLFDNIWIADPLMGWGSGGRIKSVNGNVINLRDPIYVQTIGNFNMKVQDVGNVVEVTVAPTNTGDCYQLNIVSGTLPNTLPDRTQFTVEDSVNGIGFAKPFRVLSVQENQNGADSYTITALEVDQNKYADADNLTNTTASVPYSFVLERMPQTPIGLTATAGTNELQKTKDGKVVSRIFATWGNPANSYVKNYELRWREANSGSWQTQPVYGTQVYIGPVRDGTSYDIQVRSIGYYEGESPWTAVLTVTANGKTAAPNPLTNLTAVGDIFQNIISFSFPADLDLETIELQSSATDDVTTATALTTLAYPTAQFKHTGLLPNQTVYYWARVKDTSGNWSPLFPATTAGVGATVSADPSKILTQLDKSITESQLTDALTTKIDTASSQAASVPDLETKVDQNTADLDTRLQQAEDAAQALIDSLLKASSNQDTGRTHKKQITDLQASDNNLSARIQDILDLNIDANSALLSRLNSMSASINGNSASITDIESLNLSSSTALMTKFSSLQSSIDGNSASITNIENLSLDSTTALMTKFSSLQASINNNASSITNEQTARANGDSANASDINSLKSSLSANGTQTVTASAFSSLQSQVNTNGSNISSNTTSITNLTNSLSVNGSQTVTATSFSNLQTQVNTNGSNISSNTSSISSLQSTVNGNSSSITTLQNTSATQSNNITTLQAQYVMKTDAYGHIAGIGLASSGTDQANATSSVEIFADKFGIILPGAGSGASPIIPFVVGNVNGVSTVGINGALVVDGSVTAKAISVSSLSAISANLGNVTIGTSGSIKGGQTDFNTGSGFFLGYSSSTYKFSIGDGASNSLAWDGTKLTVKGDLTLKNYTPGTILVHGNDTAVNVGANGNPYKVKSTIVPRSGTVSVSFALYVTSGYVSGYLAINGTKVTGTDINANVGTGVNTSVVLPKTNITVNAGDSVEVWAVCSSGTQSANAQNLRFYCGQDGLVQESDVS